MMQPSCETMREIPDVDLKFNAFVPDNPIHERTLRFICRFIVFPGSVVPCELIALFGYDTMLMNTSAVVVDGEADITVHSQS